MSQKTLAELNACSKDDFVAALANIFEYSPWIAEQAAAARPFAGVKPLFAAMKAAVDQRGARTAPGADQGASRSRQQDPARRRPHRRIQRRTEQPRPRPVVGRRIRGVRARQQCLPRQVRLSLHRLRPPPHQGFGAARFRAPAAERRRDRNPDLDRGNLPDRGACASINWWRRTTGCTVHGRLSTHVLDTHSGKPAAGISVELVELSDLGASRVVDARGHQQRRPHRSAADRRPAGADRPLRTDLQRRQIFCRAAACRCPIRRSSIRSRCGFR